MWIVLPQIDNRSAKSTLRLSMIVARGVEAMWRPILIALVLIYQILPSLTLNVGHLMAFKSLTEQYGEVPYSYHPLYGVGLRSGDDRAPIARWLHPARNLADGHGISASISLLTLMRGLGTPHEDVWLARLNLLTGDLQSALASADSAAQLGFSSGIRERGYVHDVAGDSMQAIEAYGTIDSSMSRDFQIANHLSLAEECPDSACKDLLYYSVAKLDPHFPIVVWNAAKQERNNVYNALHQAHWYYSDPRLQRAMSLTLVEIMQSDWFTFTDVEEILLFWVDNALLDSARIFLELSSEDLNPTQSNLWNSRIAFRAEDYATAYSSLKHFSYMLSTNPCAISYVYCRELAIYAYHLALQSDSEVRRYELMEEVEELLIHLLVSFPEDVMVRYQLFLVQTDLGNPQALVHLDLLDKKLGALPLIRQSCNIDTSNIRFGDTVLRLDPADIGEWYSVVRTGDPYTDGTYDVRVSYLGGSSVFPVLSLHGLSVARQINDEWPSWAGVQVKHPIQLDRREKVYVFTFAYKTDLHTGWQMVRFLPTRELEIWLPDTYGQWRYYGIVLPTSHLSASFEPVFRLYQSSGNIFLQDFRFRGLVGPYNPTNCSPSWGILE